MADDYIDVPTSTDPDTIAAAILDALMESIPGFVPRDGQLEVVIINLVARAIAENRDVASRVPTSIFRFFGQTIIGLPPVDAASALVPSTWTVTNDDGHTIPAGTLVGFKLASDQQAYFQTVDQVTIAPGATATASGEVLLRAINPGAAYNGIPAGPVRLVDALAYVDSVTSTAVTAGGQDAETDPAYLARLREELKLQTARPILPPDFAVLAKRIPGVDRAITIDGYNPANGTYNNTRMVTVALADVLGNAVPDTVRASVSAYLESLREANFLVNTIGPTYTAVDVDATLKALPGANVDTIRAAAVDALKRYLNPASWNWATVVRRNELISLLDQIPGVDYVDAVTSPADNIVLQGVAPLAQSGNISITVEAG
jgi:uncharacterized phage protein gp47/JayE